MKKEDENKPPVAQPAPAGCEAAGPDHGPGAGPDLAEAESREQDPLRDIRPDGSVLLGQGEFNAMQRDLEKHKKEASANYERYVRVSAELENLRKRCEKEKSDLQKFGHEAVLKALLPVLDSFERATAEIAAEEDGTPVSPLADGVLMVRKQLTEVLGKQGLVAINAVGASFDPNLHQAIRKEEDPLVEEELVREEYSKGYLLNDRLIRPAMVSVAVPAGS